MKRKKQVSGSTQRQIKVRDHHHVRNRIAWSFVTVLTVLVVVAWWGPVSNAMDGLLGMNSEAQSPSSVGIHPDSVKVSTDPGTGSSSTAQIQLHDATPASPDTSGPTNTDTTANTKSNSTTTQTPNNDSRSAASTDSNTNTESDSALANFYVSIGTGQSKQQLISLMGSVPNNCVTTEILLLGTQQICVWNGDGGTIVVTLLNNQVVAKQSIGL